MEQRYPHHRGGRGGADGGGSRGGRGGARGGNPHRGGSSRGGGYDGNQHITRHQQRGGGSNRHLQHQQPHSTNKQSTGTVMQTTERRSGVALTSPQAFAEVQTETRAWPENFLKELCRLLAEKSQLTELCHLAQVCRAWNIIASDDSLWRSIYQKRWRDPVPLNMKETEHRWKDLFAAKVRFSVSHLLTYFDLDEEPTDYGEEDQPAAYGDYLDLMGDSNAICSSFEELDLYEVHLKDLSYSSSSSRKHKQYPPTLEVNEKEHIVIAQNKSVDYILLLDISHFEGLATPQNPKVVLWEMLPTTTGGDSGVGRNEVTTKLDANATAAEQTRGEGRDNLRKRDDSCNEYTISETFLHFLYQNCFHKWEMNYNQEAYPYSEELFSTLHLEYVEENALMQIASNLGFESLFFSDAHNFCGVSKDEDALIFYSKGRMIFDICTETKELLTHYRDTIKSQLRRPSTSSSSSHHQHSYHNHHQQYHNVSEQRHYQQHQYHQPPHQSQSYHRYGNQQQARPYYQPQHYQQQYYQHEQHYYPYYLPPQPGFYLPPPYPSGAYPTPTFNYADVYQPQPQPYGYPPSQFAGGEDDGDEGYYHEGDEANFDPSPQFTAMSLRDQPPPLPPQSTP